MSLKKNRVIRCAVLVVIAATVTGFGHVPVLRELGTFLVTEDPLEPAAAIVALAGQTPFREMEAAKLYRAGWAPRIVIVRSGQNEEARALSEMGIKVGESWELSRDVLLKQGVPISAILIPNNEGGGTLEELQTVVRDLDSKEMPLILVTSKYHARRTRLTWNYINKGHPRGIVRSAARDPFDPTRWWQERRFVLAVVREYLGLINYCAGYPIGWASGG